VSGRIRKHIQQNVVGYLALFLVLTGGTAMAVDGPLPGQNQVGSEDIINGEVKNADLGTDAVASGKIIDRQVKNADLSLGASSSNTIADGGIQGIDVKNNTLTGTQIDESTLFNDNSLTGADIDESSLTGLAQTSARASDSFAPGIATRLEANAGLGVLFVVSCDDGGTPGNDSDDTVSIGLINLNPDPLQVFIERENAASNAGSVSPPTLTRAVIGQNNSTTSTPAVISTHRFYVSPLGDSQSTIIAEASGFALPGSDNCAGVIQATRSTNP
jgi:hypothetical protein